MLENIIIKNFPQKSGVYWFVNDKDEIIYIGSSSNLYHRMNQHRNRIKNLEFERQQNLYNYLRNNTFTVKFIETEKYEELEMEMVLKYSPVFNTQMNNKYLPKEMRLSGPRKYNKRLCNYNGEILTIHALGARLHRLGLKISRKDLKQYLIE